MSNRLGIIFIVDDDPLLTTMLSDYLKEQNPKMTVRSFPTGEACLAALGESPDLVILDYFLNSKEKDAANGIDILKEIKAENKAIPVIMLSGNKSYSTAAHTIGYGAMHFVLKGQSAFKDIQDLIDANL